MIASDEMTLRIVHVITTLDADGAQLMLCRLLRAMDRRSFASEVLCLTGPGRAGERIASMGFRVRCLGMTSAPADAARLLRLVSCLRAERVHVVQTWMYHADLMGGVAAYLSGRIPVAWGIRQTNLDARATRPRTIRVARLCARLSRVLPRRIVCCSDAARRAHADLGYSREKMVVIQNGFDLESFRPDPAARAGVRAELGVEESTPLVGLVGRLDAVKDHRTFFRAAGLVARERPAVHFVACGEGVSQGEPSLRRLVAEAGIAGRCHLLGWREDVTRITAALDVACSSSFGEGFSNTIGEAMASAVPCVATAVGDAAATIGDTGVVVPPEAPEAFAAGVLRLLELPAEQRRALGAAARERIRREFDLPAVASRYEALYRELASGDAGVDRVRG
ncbi:MAG: hypothetical protein QOD06_2794 [Candidatus Binatota bacterium]|nr:hypothetical protein [Candidatus Binatota bacterium]